MKLAVDGFDWDDGNRGKCREHGVSVDEIEALFNAEPLVAPDAKHSRSELRFIATGRNGDGRPMFVAFAFRSRDGLSLIRPVSARYMHAKEIRSYEAARS
ncbi:MAG TPA: BrnT family toxin [Caulobacteraceae bacterium]|nr:BrnT family toxin [Caulobacteraceae bacterium]